MIYFVSDTHYGHKNIVRGVSEWTDLSGCRDFETLETHNQWVVDSINKRVKWDDTLYHLGDWSFGGQGNIFTLYDRLEVKEVHLLLGNHDHHQAKVGAYNELFTSISNYKELQIGNLQLVLCHYPLESWNNMERGSIHLHGHCHGNMRQIDGRYDVGLDGIGLVSLDEVRKLKPATTHRHQQINGGNKFGV